MAEEAKAATQYGDIKGTISADGFDGIRIDDLYVRAEVPKGYQPIGMRIAGSKREKNGELRIRARVLCVDTDQTGSAPDEIKKFGRENGELHTFEFDAEIEIDDILRLVKRYDIVLIDKIARGIDVKIQPIDD
jgi:hypothetical protein